MERLVTRHPRRELMLARAAERGDEAEVGVRGATFQLERQAEAKPQPSPSPFGLPTVMRRAARGAACPRATTRDPRRPA